MLSVRNKQTGFTIVELLIVIVVIGILAAITIISFNGVSNRANDTAVQSDLRNLAGKVFEQQALTGTTPAGLASGDVAGIDGIASFSVSKGSYKSDGFNLYYCAGPISGLSQFAVAAVSKSGKQFMYRSDTGASEYTGAWGNSAVNCPGLGFTNGYTYGLGRNNDGSWASWIN